jgi:hypothetical protein
MSLLDRYRKKLSTIPPPGRGCHCYIMGVVDLGVKAGLSAERIFQDIRRSIPPGDRKVPDREIVDAINKALADHGKGHCRAHVPNVVPVVQDGKSVLQRIIDQATITDEADLLMASPIRLSDEPQGDPVLLLSTLYEPGDLVWIGERYQVGVVGHTIRTASDWITYFQNGGKAGPHIIPNPMTGREGLTKGGKPSFRCDNTVKVYGYGLVEFDTLSKAEQIRFWSAVKLPLYALIDSGGKSIHAWIDVQQVAKIETPEQWATEIKGNLYEQLLTPLGVDSACSNPARLSRLPGHFRQEKQAYQRLLWLSLEGRPICQ